MLSETRRLTLASIWHGIFIVPPGDVKTLLYDSVDRGPRSKDIVALKNSMHVSSLIGFRWASKCALAQILSSFQPTKESLFTDRTKPSIDLHAVLRHVVGQNLHLSSTPIKPVEHMPNMPRSS